MVLRFSRLTLCAICLAFAPASLAAPSGGEFGRLIASSKGELQAEVPFVSAELLVAASKISVGELERVAAQAEVEIEILSRGLRDFADLAAAKERLAAEGSLTANGCFKVWPPEFEFSLLEPAEPTASFEDLVQRAYSVVLVEVDEARLGYYQGRLGVRVIATVRQSLAPSQASFPPGRRVEYLQHHYSFATPDRRFCLERSGFHSAQRGDLLVLLAVEPSRSKPRDLFLLSLVFPVLEDAVEMQPYTFLTTTRAVPLARLRAMLEGVEAAP